MRGAPGGGRQRRARYTIHVWVWAAKREILLRDRLERLQDASAHAIGRCSALPRQASGSSEPGVGLTLRLGSSHRSVASAPCAESWWLSCADA